MSIFESRIWPNDVLLYLLLYVTAQSVCIYDDDYTASLYRHPHPRQENDDEIKYATTIRECDGHEHANFSG